MARRDYHGTLFHPDLTEATFELYLTSDVKYKHMSLEDAELVTFTGVKAWSIIEGGREAEVLEEVFDEDEYHEYLILTFVNGKQEVYRNSHVVMFVH